MSSDNHTVQIGNLTDDPELKLTPTGTQVTSFRLAVTPRLRDDDGSWRNGEPSFVRVNVWRDQAENVAESLHKGDRAIVVGRLKTRSWETPDGDKRQVTEIEADEVAPSLKWAIASPDKATQRDKTRAGASREATGRGEFVPDAPPF